MSSQNINCLQETCSFDSFITSETSASQLWSASQHRRDLQLEESRTNAALEDTGNGTGLGAAGSKEGFVLTVCTPSCDGGVSARVAYQRMTLHGEVEACPRVQQIEFQISEEIGAALL